MASIQDIDLHLHTTYSDGRNTLASVFDYLQKNKLKYISITDHNTVQGNIVLRQQGEHAFLIAGTELRLPGMPDILIYFPEVSLSELIRIEEELTEISRLDQEITLLIANEYLGNEALELWKSSCFFNTQGNYWLGTFQLSQLLAQSSEPSHEIIKEIRSKKSRILKQPEKCESARQLLDISCFEWIKDFSSRHKGHAVLAHPYRELIRRFHQQMVMDLSLFKEFLSLIFDECNKWNLKTIEHILYYSEKWWEQHFSFNSNDANRIFMNLCREKKFTITIGSDSHDLCQSSGIISSLIDEEIAPFLPSWIRD